MLPQPLRPGDLIESLRIPRLDFETIKGNILEGVSLDRILSVSIMTDMLELVFLVS